jgi:hypothetical protein
VEAVPSRMAITLRLLASGCPLLIMLASKEKSLPAGATIPSLSAMGIALLLASPRTGGNPRTCPGNNVVVVALLLEGVAYDTFRVLRAWWDFSGGCNGHVTSSLSSSRPSRHHFRFSCSFCFFLEASIDTASLFNSWLETLYMSSLQYSLNYYTYIYYK